MPTKVRITSFEGEQPSDNTISDIIEMSLPSSDSREAIAILAAEEDFRLSLGELLGGQEVHTITIERID